MKKYVIILITQSKKLKKYQLYNKYNLTKIIFCFYNYCQMLKFTFFLR